MVEFPSGQHHRGSAYSYWNTEVSRFHNSGEGFLFLSGHIVQAIAVRPPRFNVQLCRVNFVT